MINTWVVHKKTRFSVQFFQALINLWWIKFSINVIVVKKNSITFPIYSYELKTRFQRFRAFNCDDDKMRSVNVCLISDLVKANQLKYKRKTLKGIKRNISKYILAGNRSICRDYWVRNVRNMVSFTLSHSYFISLIIDITWSNCDIISRLTILLFGWSISGAFQHYCGIIAIACIERFCKFCAVGLTMWVRSGTCGPWSSHLV